MKITINLQGFKVLSLAVVLALFTLANSYADPIVKKTRSVENFTGIKVGGAFNVVLNQTGSYKLVVEAEEDLHEKIRTEVKGNVLHIDMSWNWKWKDHEDITIYIDFKDLNYLNVSGAADVTSRSPIKSGDMELEVSGAADMEFEIVAKTLEVEVSGAADLSLSGTIDEQKVRLSGAGDYKAADLKSGYTDARASGAGTVTVHASQEIEAYASGASTVRIYGDPPKQKTNSSGAGSIRMR